MNAWIPFFPFFIIYNLPRSGHADAERFHTASLKPEVAILEILALQQDSM